MHQPINETRSRVRENHNEQNSGTIIAAALALTAVPASAQTTLKVRPFGDLKTIDPMVTSDYMVRNHGYMIYDTLFAQDEKGAIKPQMVQSFTTAPDSLEPGPSCCATI